MDQLISDTIADARWFPLRLDVQREEIHFVWTPPELQRAVTFISDLGASDAPRRIVAARALANARITEAPLHLILHSGLGGSTLLARALAQEGIVTTLKEPPILTDIIALGLRQEGPAAEAVGDLATRLLARPFAAGEAVVIKMSSVGNGLAATMAAPRTQSRLLCLHGPLEAMLASLARRGDEGRVGGRRLFIGLRNSGVADLGFSEKQLSELTDLQLAALGWLAIQRIMLQSAARFGPDRVRSLSSGDLMRRPRETLAAVAGHFALDLDIDRRLASGIFGVHAKTGEPFDAQARERALAGAMRAHGDEITLVTGWAGKVARANAIAWELPYPLFDGSAA